MFVMLSVRTSTVCERTAETGPEKVTATTITTTTTPIATQSAIASSSTDSSETGSTATAATNTTRTLRSSSSSSGAFNNKDEDTNDGNGDGDGNAQATRDTTSTTSATANALATAPPTTTLTGDVDYRQQHHNQQHYHWQQQQQQRQAPTQLQQPQQQQHTLIDDIYINNNSIIDTAFTKSISFEKNLNKSNLLLSELNNFKQPPALQAPVATILNDLSPIPVAGSKITNQEPTAAANLSPPPSHHMTPKGLQDNSPDVKAMRYYRLWIYTCNAVLLMAVIVFCGVAGKVLLADYRRLLVNGLNLTQPSFIYAYLALLVQSGFIQFVGCLGALRLSEKLLNAYWLLLLCLLIGDMLLGIFWLFKFDRLISGLQPMLRLRLHNEYGAAMDFTDLWDRMQTDGHCCGIGGPQDFQALNRTYPTSCCAPLDLNEVTAISRRPLASAVYLRPNGDELMGGGGGGGTGGAVGGSTMSLAAAQQAQHHKLNFSEIANMAWGQAVTESRAGGISDAADGVKTAAVNMCRAIYQQGCAEKLDNWMRSTAGILIVIGYCVIAFLKLSFLGILRYEIKEMIQKIKLLQTELATSILGGATADVEQQQNCVLLQIPSTTVNNGAVHAEPKVGNRDRERNRIGSGESERESLLLHEAAAVTPKYLRTQRSVHSGSGVGGGVGGGGSGLGGGLGGGGGLGIGVEPGEDASDAAKSINGNNNYELTEFDTKAPTYRLLNAPTVTKI